MARAKRNIWVLVYTGQGLSYSDFKAMDLAEYKEAVEARILFNTEWKPQKGQ